MSWRSQPREACVLRILSLGIAHLEHLRFAGPVLVLKAIVVLPAHESEWLLRVESVRCAVLTPNAAAQPCPEGASILSSWFSRRVAAGRSSRLSCRVLPDAKRPG